MNISKQKRANYAKNTISKLSVFSLTCYTVCQTLRAEDYHAVNVNVHSYFPHLKKHAVVDSLNGKEHEHGADEQHS